MAQTAMTVRMDNQQKAQFDNGNKGIFRKSDAGLQPKP